MDRHHLLYHGTEDYRPDIDDNFNGGMGRLSRYTVDTESYTSVIPSSRFVLLGESVGTGIPIASEGHGAGAIIFGEDGSLLVSTGDTNSHSCCYNGEGPVPNSGFDDISFQDGVLSEQELLGAFRSQFLGGLSGKVLRIHPETGEGISTNPFFIEGEPRLPQSKIWALGFRNPYRMVIRPGSGWGSIVNGHPGTIFLSDVGETKWEEINVIREGGGNYGWPIYEGPNLHELGYAELITSNPMAPNPAYDSSDCLQAFFSFQELLAQENLNHTYFFENTCVPGASIPVSTPTFHHERPTLAYPNDWGGPPEVLLPAFDENGSATTTPISESAFENNSSFRSISGAGGAFLRGATIPQEYQGAYILADFSGWVRAFNLNENDELTSIEHWNDSIGRPVNMALNPFDDCIYITSLFPSFIKRICFGGNLKPVVLCTPDTIWGSSVKTVDFDATASYDPEGDDLLFSWDFGDGISGVGPIVSHTYYSTGQDIESFTATVTARDPEGAEGRASVLISLNNTPPQVKIISIDEGHLYSTQHPSVFDLFLSVSDAEEKAKNLKFRWEYLLHHNEHFHLLDEYDFMNGTAVVIPTGCGEDDNYWYEFNVEVTDKGGLTASDSKMIYPDCEETLTMSTSHVYTLFPNPAIDVLTIRSTGPLDQQIEYCIYNTIGERIQKENVILFNDSRNFKLHISSLHNGVYVIELSDGGHKERIQFLKL